MDDPGEGNIFLQLIFLLILIFINAFFSMSETAIISLNDNKVEKKAYEGNKKAKKILKLTKKPSGFLLAIKIVINFICLLISAIAAQSFLDNLTQAFLRLIPNASVGAMEAISLILITVIVSCLLLVLGDFVPRKIAMQVPEKVAFAIASPLLLIIKITKPTAKLFSAIANLIVRMLGFDPNASEESVTEEEIRMMVDVGEEKGVIENAQKEMINNIFEFDDVCVADIMTHRTDMIAVDAEDPLADVVALAIEHGYSRIPVFEDDFDNIVGIAYIKDLLKYVGGSLPKTKKMKDIMRTAFYVPKTLSCAKLFTEMGERHVQMAIVVDEYGGTAGLITLEDLLESIVGNIQDEFDNEDEDILKIDENTFTIDGTTDIEEVSEILDVEIPEGDYDTLGGFVISLLGFLPQEGESNEVDYQNIHFTVMNVEDRRIGKIRVEIVPSLTLEVEEKE
ncbi:MAG: HlyC/CorC family transporter [Clostridia bacterium]|nr:HlyC/CorC family transporter [Clostridia bacterium]